MAMSALKASEHLSSCSYLKRNCSDFIETIDSQKLDKNPVNKACIFRIVIENLTSAGEMHEAKILYEFAIKTNVWDSSKVSSPATAEKISNFAGDGRLLSGRFRIMFHWCS